MFVVKNVVIFIINKDKFGLFESFSVNMTIYTSAKRCSALWERVKEREINKMAALTREGLCIFDLYQSFS